MSWSKLVAIFKNSVDNKVENIVENSINVRRDGQAIVRQYDREIEAMNERAVKAATDIKMQEARLADNKRKISAYEQIAVKATESGETDDAQVAATKIIQLRSTNEVIQNGLDTLNPMMESIKARIAQMATEKAEIEAEILKLDLQDQLVKTQKELMGKGAGTINSGITLKNLQDHVNKARARLDAEVEFSQGENLEEKYKSTSVNQSVQDVIDELTKPKN